MVVPDEPGPVQEGGDPQDDHAPPQFMVAATHVLDEDVPGE
jgi:hypothetical protein